LAINLQKIRQLREMRHLTQKDLACQLGYRTATGYCRLEKGRRQLSAEHLLALAAILGVPVSELATQEAAHV
jgi:transcriptional regulator with XRE-family HTH domain